MQFAAKMTLSSPPRGPVRNQDGLRLAADAGIRRRRKRTVIENKTNLAHYNAARLIESKEIGGMRRPSRVGNREVDLGTRDCPGASACFAKRETTEALHRDDREDRALNGERAHTRRAG